MILNRYKNGNECIGFHLGRETRFETSWALGFGFATLSFGAERDFQIKHEASKYHNMFAQGR